MRALLVIALALLVCAPAQAYVSSGGTGSGLGRVATLDGGKQPTVAASGSTVTVTWIQTSFGGAPVGGFTGGGYRITRYPAGGGAAVAPAGTCAGRVSGAAAGLSCQDAGVPAGAWRYTVTPVLNSWTGAESAPSGEQPVSSAAPVLDAITRLDPGATESTGALRLSWSAVPDATGYDIFRRTATGTFDFAVPLNGGTPLTGITYTDAAVSAGTTYHYVVRARTGEASSPSSNSGSATPVARLAAPASVTGTLGAARVDVSWPTVTGATGYHVFRRTGAGAFARITASAVTGASYVDTAIATGTTYAYRVRSVGPGANGDLESFDSAESAQVTADATAPTGTLADPGSPRRGTVVLTATAADVGSGVATVRFQRAPANGTTWTDICTDAVAPYSCDANTTVFGGDGLYDLRALVTDVAGNQGVSTVVAQRRVDNTAPRGTTAFSAVNRTGGTAGRPEQGDVMTYTFTEPLMASTVAAGWTGSSKPVTVRFTNIGSTDEVTLLDGTTTIPLGTVLTGRDFVRGTVDFTGSPMVMSGNSIVITLGSPTGTTRTSNDLGALRWAIPAGSGITDVAGNPLFPETVTEAAGGDRDF